LIDLYERLKKFRKLMLFLLDFVIWNTSFYLSFAINKNSFSLVGFEKVFINYLIFVNFCFTFVFIFFKLYNKIWRYADIEDFFYAGLAVFCANFLFCCSTILFEINLGIRTYVLFLLVSEFLNFLVRIIYRINIVLDNNSYKPKCEKKRLLIVGAGEAAALVLREISKRAESEYLPICIADDDRSKIGRDVAGIKIKGSTYEIPRVCNEENIQIILFAIINIASSDKRRILDICANTSVEVRVIPGIYEAFTSGAQIIPSIRHVEIEDLLGREPVIFDAKKYGDYIIGKTILVTGGGGSIGSELCRQIAFLEPKNLIIFDIYENNVYDIQQELLRSFKNLNFEVQIGSVRDSAKVEKLLCENNVDVIFHAAAHKHVPLMEKNPEEAVKNNILGTLNIANSAERHKVKKFVLISTDKAVNPTSVMGATKRVCEMIVQLMNKNTKSTEFVTVRFGNVLGSNGSVVPLFEEQIRKRGPVTVTHPEVIRYFMTIPEAVSLVLTAGGIAKGGEILILDMGEPVKIKDLAENLIRLSGFVPYKEIKIEYIGLRPGEKLYEELLMAEEGAKRTRNEKIYIGNPIEFDEEKFSQELRHIVKVCENNDSETTRKVLNQIVKFY
jgi:FlaA1/EpsC-like NDP-sugar epimerase